jgi:hypothetical protein
MRKLLLLAAFLFVSIPFTQNAKACVCSGDETVDQAFKESAAVFTGTFIRAEYRTGIKNELYEDHLEMDGKKGEPYEVEVYIFAVDTWWKGPSSVEVVLESDSTRAPDGTTTVSDCGLGFEEGKKYLVYAYGEDEHLSTNACSRTMSLKRADKDTKQLGKLAKPRKPQA